MQTQVKEWGNSQGIRLPKEVLKSAGITLNEVLDVTISNGVITWDTLDFPYSIKREYPKVCVNLQTDVR